MIMRNTQARYDFSGQVAVVTGGARGIGAQIAATLRDFGATVSIWDSAAPQDDAHACLVDVTDSASLRTATATVCQRLGGIDMLINNAGFAGPTVALDE